MVDSLLAYKRRHRTVINERIRQARLSAHRTRMDRRIEVVGEVMREVADDLHSVAERIYGVAGGLFYQLDGSILLVDASDGPRSYHTTDADIRHANKVSLVAYDRVSEMLRPCVVKHNLIDFSGAWLLESRRQILSRTVPAQGLMFDAAQVESRLHRVTSV